MSNKKLTGEEQITPTLTYDETSGKPNGHLLGLTIRQHFAAMAMQGILSSGIGCTNDKESGLTDHKSVSEAAVNYADHLITSNPLTTL